MAGPIVPAMPQATVLVLGIPSYWPWHSSCCWNVTAADRWRPYTCTRLQLPSPCPLPLPSPLRPPGTRPGLSLRLMSPRLAGLGQAPKKAAQECRF